MNSIQTHKAAYEFKANNKIQYFILTMKIEKKIIVINRFNAELCN